MYNLQIYKICKCLFGGRNSICLIPHVSFHFCLFLFKVSLTSYRTCTYVLVTEKNQLICKAHLRYTYDFITEFKGRTGPAMKTDMHISSACTQHSHKHIHFSRVTYERLTHVHFPCKCSRSPHSLAQFAHAV